MTHSKLDIDSILAQYITRETHKGSVNRVRILAKQALLEAFEQSLPDKISEYDSEVPYNHLTGWNDYRNEAIKVIRGKNNG